MNKARRGKPRLRPPISEPKPVQRQRHGGGGDRTVCPLAPSPPLASPPVVAIGMLPYIAIAIFLGLWGLLLHVRRHRWLDTPDASPNHPAASTTSAAPSAPDAAAMPPSPLAPSRRPNQCFLKLKYFFISNAKFC